MVSTESNVYITVSMQKLCHSPYKANQTETRKLALSEATNIIKKTWYSSLSLYKVALVRASQ